MQEICEKLNFPGHLSVECNGSIWARKKIKFSQLDMVDMNSLKPKSFKPETPFTVFN